MAGNTKDEARLIRSTGRELRSDQHRWLDFAAESLAERGLPSVLVECVLQYYAQPPLPLYARLAHRNWLTGGLTVDVRLDALAVLRVKRKNRANRHLHMEVRVGAPVRVGNLPLGSWIPSADPSLRMGLHTWMLRNKKPVVWVGDYAWGASIIRAIAFAVGCADLADMLGEMDVGPVSRS